MPVNFFLPLLSVLLLLICAAASIGDDDAAGRVWARLGGSRRLDSRPPVEGGVRRGNGKLPPPELAFIAAIRAWMPVSFFGVSSPAAAAVTVFGVGEVLEEVEAADGVPDDDDDGDDGCGDAAAFCLARNAETLLELVSDLPVATTDEEEPGAGGDAAAFCLARKVPTVLRLASAEFVPEDEDAAGAAGMLEEADADVEAGGAAAAALESAAAWFCLAKNAATLFAFGEVPALPGRACPVALPTAVAAASALRFAIMSATRVDFGRAA